jgi:hypothetical protein
MLKQFLLALCLLFVAPAAFADRVARQGADSARLQDGPCVNKAVLATVPKPLQSQFRAGVALVEGKRHPFCYIERPDGQVYLFYADGDKGMIPASDFETPKTL